MFCFLYKPYNSKSNKPHSILQKVVICDRHFFSRKICNPSKFKKNKERRRNIFLPTFLVQYISLIIIKKYQHVGTPRRTECDTRPRLKRSSMRSWDNRQKLLSSYSSTFVMPYTQVFHPGRGSICGFGVDQLITQTFFCLSYNLFLHLNTFLWEVRIKKCFKIISVDCNSLSIC